MQYQVIPTQYRPMYKSTQLRSSAVCPSDQTVSPLCQCLHTSSFQTDIPSYCPFVVFNSSFRDISHYSSHLLLCLTHSCGHGPICSSCLISLFGQATPFQKSLQFIYFFNDLFLVVKPSLPFSTVEIVFQLHLAHSAS